MSKADTVNSLKILMEVLGRELDDILVCAEEFVAVGHLLWNDEARIHPGSN